MANRFAAGAAMLSLAFGSGTPALAQSGAFAGSQARPGASATINLRVPLGPGRRSDRPTVGFTASCGQALDDSGPDGRRAVRELRITDLRFDGRALARAELATFDLANLENDARMGLVGNKKNTLLLFVMVLAGATALAFLLNGHERSTDSTGNTSNPTPG